MDKFSCPFEYTQKVLKGKWSILIIYKINEKKGSRFLELKSELTTITSSTLTQQLNYLIDEGIVDKIDNNTYPRIVCYKLTTKGLELKKVVKQFRNWGLKYM